MPNLRKRSFEIAHLLHARFESAQLAGAEFSGITNAVDTDFSRTVMNGAKMTTCKWKDIKFNDANLESHDIEECNFTACRFPRASATPNTYGGIYGLDCFPFHSDLAHWRRPPRYLLLRCVVGYADVGTLLVDGRRLINAVTADLLARAIFNWDGALLLLRLCDPTHGGHRLRWDKVFLKSASKIGDIASQRVREYLTRSAAEGAINILRNLVQKALSLLEPLAQGNPVHGP